MKSIESKIKNWLIVKLGLYQYFREKMQQEKEESFEEELSVEQQKRLAEEKAAEDFENYKVMEALMKLDERLMEKGSRSWRMESKDTGNRFVWFRKDLL